MTKSELQTALAEAAQTDKKTAGMFLNALGPIAYKVVKKEGEFVLPGFGKLVKQKRAARTQFNPTTRQKVKVAAKTTVRFRVAKGGRPAQPRRAETIQPAAAQSLRRGSSHQQSQVTGPVILPLIAPRSLRAAPTHARSTPRPAPAGQGRLRPPAPTT